MALSNDGNILGHCYCYAETQAEQEHGSKLKPFDAGHFNPTLGTCNFEEKEVK